MRSYATAEKVVTEFAAVKAEALETLAFYPFETEGLTELLTALTAGASAWVCGTNSVTASQSLSHHDVVSAILDRAADRAGTPLNSGMLTNNGDGTWTLTW